MGLMYVVGAVDGGQLYLASKQVFNDRRKAFAELEKLQERVPSMDPNATPLEVFSLTETNGPIGRRTSLYTVAQLREAGPHVAQLDEFHLAWREYFLDRPEVVSSDRYTMGLWPREDI